MTTQPGNSTLALLLETVALEATNLLGTDERLFSQPFTFGRAATLRDDHLLAERLDAFSARFARLQDTLGDELLPALLARIGEPRGKRSGQPGPRTPAGPAAARH